MAQHCTACGEALTDDARFCPSCGTAVIVVATPSKDPLLGQVVADRYLIQDKIGQGRSGTIYRAEHNTLHRKMAVKVLHSQLSRDEAAVERFRREATTIGQLDNDHLLQIFDFGRTADQRLFFAMELLEGETLDAVLGHTPRLEAERTANILRQVAEALSQAHEQGYIHRDLRPRNVFLSVRRGTPDFVKLLDFGLAKLVLPDVEQRHTALGMTFGDARYMSPEQARGDAIDPRSDVYAIGVVGFQMLTGQVPFAGKGPFEILQKMLSSDPPRVTSLRPDCQQWLVDMIARCLRRNPADRFSGMPELLDAMERRKEPRPAPVVIEAEPESEAESEPARELGEETNPGRRPKGFLRELPAGVPGPNDPPTITDSVSGEVHALPRSTRQTDDGPSIVVDASVQADRDDPTGPHRPSAMQVRTAPSGKRDAATERLTTEMPIVVQGESTGPQRVAGDDGWFKSNIADDELEAAAPRGRGPLFIAAIAGGVAMVGIAIVALWPHAHPQDPPSRAAPIARSPVAPTPVTTPIVVPAPPVSVAPPVKVTNVEPTPRKEVPARKPEPKLEAKIDSPLRPEPVAAKPKAEPTPTKESTPPKPRGFVDPFATTRPTPGQADVLVRQGRAKIASGDMSQAQASFTQARQLDPRNADAVAGLAEVSFESGEYGNAAAMLRQALRLSPNRARFLVLLGQSYYKMGKPKDAVVAYRQALKVDPTNQEAQRSLDLATKKLGE